MECDKSEEPTFLSSESNNSQVLNGPVNTTIDRKIIEELPRNLDTQNSSELTATKKFPLLSKKQVKREQKFQKRLQMKAEWKLQRKLKKERRKARSETPPSSSKVGKPKITTMAESKNKIHVVIDFSYDELMSVKDLVKCGNQVVRCYSANRRSSNPVQLHFCNFSGKITEEMSKCYEYGNWDIHLHEDAYLNVFPKEDLVYLTSESRNVLETLEENKAYIIGGLVDHNAHKGVSYRKAVQEGIAHAQLPIKKYIQMTSRSVLTINHVFEILLKVSNGESWSESLSNAVPQRFYSSLVPSKKNKNTSEAVSLSEEDDDDREDESTSHNEQCPKNEDPGNTASDESSKVTNSIDDNT